jgi:hypothetical protein
MGHKIKKALPGENYSLEAKSALWPAFVAAGASSSKLVHAWYCQL